MSDRDFRTDLIDRIIRYATAHDDLGPLLTEFCERLVGAGLPIWRASIDIPTIDPNSRALTHKWWRDRDAVIEALPHGAGQEEAWRRSAIFYLLSRGLEMGRWRLERGDGIAEFDLLASLQAAGGTDYLMRIVSFGDGGGALRGAALSIATDRAGGFVDDEIVLINRFVPALGLAAYRMAVARTATDVLTVYLGPRTARRVLDGQIQRGEGERIAAAILYADLKRFTSLSEREDSLRIVGWLNEHFEAIGDAVAARGGEILKFLGDGLLAVFPVADPDRLPCEICEEALRAAEEAVASNQALNEKRALRREPTLEVDVALHFGQVVYRNVGTSRRLDFTVIGRAVNETSRMEALCDQVGRNIVLSETFARRCARPTVEVGAFALRGITGERVLYATCP